MSSTRQVNLAAAPLSKTVLTAKRYRLETRRKEALLAAGVLGAALMFSTWGCIAFEGHDSSAMVSVLAVGLAVLFVCILQVLVLNCVERIALLPATDSQLEHVEHARHLPVVGGYLAAVEAHKRSLNRREAATIIVYRHRQPGTAARVGHKKENFNAGR
jgi:hypothetical protein